MATIRPLQDRIVIKQEMIQRDPSSLIVIPDNVKQTPTEGVVVAVGPGKYDENDQLIPMVVKVGDRVAFAKATGAPVVVEKQEYLMMRECDILGILK